MAATHRRGIPARNHNPFSQDDGRRLHYRGDNRYGPQTTKFPANRRPLHIAALTCCGFILILILIPWSTGPSSENVDSSRLQNIKVASPHLPTSKPALDFGYKPKLKDAVEEEIPYHRPGEEEDFESANHQEVAEEERTKEKSEDSQDRHFGYEEPDVKTEEREPEVDAGEDAGEDEGEDEGEDAGEDEGEDAEEDEGEDEGEAGAAGEYGEDGDESPLPRGGENGTMKNSTNSAEDEGEAGAPGEYGEDSDEPALTRGGENGTTKNSMNNTEGEGEAVDTGEYGEDGDESALMSGGENVTMKNSANSAEDEGEAEAAGEYGEDGDEPALTRGGENGTTKNSMNNTEDEGEAVAIGEYGEDADESALTSGGANGTMKNFANSAEDEGEAVAAGEYGEDSNEPALTSDGENGTVKNSTNITEDEDETVGTGEFGEDSDEPALPSYGENNTMKNSTNYAGIDSNSTLVDEPEDEDDGEESGEGESSDKEDVPTTEEEEASTTDEIPGASGIVTAKNATTFTGDSEQDAAEEDEEGADLPGLEDKDAPDFVHGVTGEEEENANATGIDSNPVAFKAETINDENSNTSLYNMTTGMIDEKKENSSAAFEEGGEFFIEKSVTTLIAPEGNSESLGVISDAPSDGIANKNLSLFANWTVDSGAAVAEANETDGLAGTEFEAPSTPTQDGSDTSHVDSETTKGEQANATFAVGVVDGLGDGMTFQSVALPENVTTTVGAAVENATETDSRLGAGDNSLSATPIDDFDPLDIDVKPPRDGQANETVQTGISDTPGNDFANRTTPSFVNGTFAVDVAVMKTEVTAGIVEAEHLKVSTLPRGDQAINTVAEGSNGTYDGDGEMVLYGNGTIAEEKHEPPTFPKKGSKRPKAIEHTPKVNHTVVSTNSRRGEDGLRSIYSSSVDPLEDGSVPREAMVQDADGVTSPVSPGDDAAEVRSKLEEGAFEHSTNVTAMERRSNAKTAYGRGGNLSHEGDGEKKKANLMALRTAKESSEMKLTDDQEIKDSASASHTNLRGASKDDADASTK